MARFKNKGLPHHVKERLRHQNLQKILEDVASHVPKPTSIKKETKAKKLRRVVLYMKYLIHKKEELDETKIAVKNITKSQDIAVKKNATFPEFSPVHKSKRKRAQIVFLTKFSDKTKKQEDISSLIHQKCCSIAGNELEIQTEKNTDNVVDQNSPNYGFSAENAVKLFHPKTNKSDIAYRYVPNMAMENGYSCDFDLWKEGFPAISKSNAENRICKTGSNYITKEFNEDQNYYNHGKENILSELDKNGTDLDRYIQVFSKDLEKMQRSYSPEKNLYLSDKLEKRSSDEYSLHYIENPQLFKSLQSSCSDVQLDKHQHNDKPTLSQSSDNFTFKVTSKMTPSNSFEMPGSFNNSVTQKNYCLCNDDIKIDKQCSKHKTLSQKSINSSSDFISSGESGAFTTLHGIAKPCPSNCSERQKNGQPIQCDIIVDKRQFSKHPSFSQSSDNFSSDIFSSGESGTFISSNEYILSENEQIGFSDAQHQSTNTSPSTSFKVESAMGEDSCDFSLTPPQRNCDIMTSPDIFCDKKPDIPHGVSDFSVNNILSNTCCKSPFSFSPNSERCLDYGIHGPNYNLPVFHNTGYSNVVDGRFINYFGMNSYSQNLPLHALPRFSAIGNYPTVKMGDVGRCSNSVANDGNFINDPYSSEKAYDFDHSIYAEEGMRNHLGVRIKQEDTEPFLPPEELSYSFNNFANSGYCYSQRDFNTH